MQIFKLFLRALQRRRYCARALCALKDPSGRSTLIPGKHRGHPHSTRRGRPLPCCVHVIIIAGSLESSVNMPADTLAPLKENSGLSTRRAPRWSKVRREERERERERARSSPGSCKCSYEFIHLVAFSFIFCSCPERESRFNSRHVLCYVRLAVNSLQESAKNFPSLLFLLQFQWLYHLLPLHPTDLDRYFRFTRERSHAVLLDI